MLAYPSRQTTCAEKACAGRLLCLDSIRRLLRDRARPDISCLACASISRGDLRRQEPSAYLYRAVCRLFTAED
jgi:hypothetical protein